tara:strand:+ start:10666 stop:12555 length:1890 start_codon:yes stop_codon:yes gene_type:complete
MSTSFTGRQIANSYKEILKIDTSVNQGIIGALQTIQSGDGLDSALQLSDSRVNVNGIFTLNGVDITVDASTINAFTSITNVTGLVAVAGGSVYGRTLTGGSGITISNAAGGSGNPTIAVSLTGVHISAASAHFTGNVTAAEFWGPVIGNVTGNLNGNVDGTRAHITASIGTANLVAQTGSFTTKVSGAAAQFSGDVSVATSIYATGAVFSGTVSAASFAGDGSGLTNVPSSLGGTVTRITAGTGIGITVDGVTSSSIPVSGTVLVSEDQPGIKTLGTVSVGTVVVSTKISAPSGAVVRFNGDVSTNNLYAATNVYIGGSAIPDAAFRTSINSVIANTSSALATSIGNSNTLIANTSSALATSIGNSNTNITTNASAITSINGVIGDGTGFVTDSELATVSAALATSIGNSNTLIANTSSALATSIGNSNTNITTNASAITSINTVIGTVSAALATSIGNSNSAITSINTVIANVSSALATSIGNHLPLAGGTITGIVSATDVYVSAIAIGVNALLGKNLHIEKAAVADLVSLTDAGTVAVDFNAGQNFHLTLADNRALGNPTNCVAGQVGSIFIVQDGTGSRTLSYGSSWEFIGGTAPTLSTDAAAVDRLDYIVRTSTAVQSILSQGYS